MPAGSFELKLFQNLYTQTAFFDGNFKRQPQGFRSTFYNSLTEFIYGVSPRFNAGFRMFVRSVRTGPSDQSPLHALRMANSPDARVALSAIGPRIKFMPFPSVKGLSVENTLFIPIAPDQEAHDRNQPWMAFDAFENWFQVFYDRPLQHNLQFFFEATAWIRVDRHLDTERLFSVTTPWKAFLGYFPNDKLTFYMMGDVGPTWSGNLRWSALYGQTGVGGRYLILPFMEVEVLYTNFLIGRHAGAGATYNLSLRFVK